MAVNKVEINGVVKLDLTHDTVTKDTLLQGVTAHDAAGNLIEGTMSGGGGGGGESAFRKMIDITTTEDVAEIEINEDMDGNKLSMRRFIFNVEVPAASGSANAFFGSGSYRWLYGADTAQMGSGCSKSLQLGTSKAHWWGEFVMNVEQDGAHAILYMRASKTPYPDNVTSSDGGTYDRYDVRKYPYSSGAGIYYLHESFDRIFYKTDSSTVMIPAGTKIKVWGIDA